MKVKNLTASLLLAIVSVPLMSAQNNCTNVNCPNNASCATAADCNDPACTTKLPPEATLLGGPGIVVSESATQNQLPAKAQEFLQTYYSRVMVTSVNHNIVKDTYNVELGNGVKVTFTGNGSVKNIYAPGTDALFEPVIKAVLPEKAYNHLAQAGLLYEVTAITNAEGKGLSVQLLKNIPPEILFDVDGVFIIVDD